MFGIDAPEPEPIPEPEDETARRKAQQVRRRRARGGRVTTVNPSRTGGQPNGNNASSLGTFGAGLGIYR